jgi:hypothetical protein
MPAWWESKKNKDDKEEYTLPPEIQEQLDQAKKVTLELEGVKTKLAGLDELTTYVREQRQAAEDAKKPKPIVKTQDDIENENAELAQLLLTDPQAAYARLADKTNATVLMVRADNLRREVFEDNAEKFPYYTGDVKLEINKILSNESLQFRNNPQALENTYYTVVGKRQKDITEGKIKDRFASANGSGRGTTTEDTDKLKITGNADTEKIAKILDMKHEDYIKLLEMDPERYV